MGLMAAVSVMGNLDIWIVAPEGWKSISLHIRVRFGQFKEFLCYKITLGLGGWDHRHKVGSGKIIADIKQRAIELSGERYRSAATSNSSTSCSSSISPSTAWAISLSPFSADAADALPATPSGLRSDIFQPKAC